ncbi:transcriptional regulator [Microbulbifer sp. TRSA002]|uniref:helix-turn-helix transcriptional regulator n=1 Tax=Microbulbifer sp. TRSA002 TaxID=3243382 RepID=UPI00403955AD
MNPKDMFFDHDESLSKAEERAFCREELIYNVTEDLLVIMEDMGVSKKELARRLGKSRSYVTQILSGSRNMTLGSFSDVCYVLGFKPKIKMPVEESFDDIKGSIDIESWESQFIDFLKADIQYITGDIDFVQPKSEVRESSNVIDCTDERIWKGVA